MGSLVPKELYLATVMQKLPFIRDSVCCACVLFQHAKQLISSPVASAFRTRLHIHSVRLINKEAGLFRNCVNYFVKISVLSFVDSQHKLYRYFSH